MQDLDGGNTILILWGSRVMAETTNIQEIITENIARIKRVVQECSTESVVGYIMIKHLRGFPQQDLASPAKQLRFLLGVVLETKEPDAPNEFAEQEWRQVVEPIQRLSGAYMSLYLPSDETTAKQSEEWYEIQQVVMTAFLDYHQKGLLASTEQIRDRIRSYLAPFDDQLSYALGISASEALSIGLDIGTEIQKQMERVLQYAANSSKPADVSMEIIEAIKGLGRTRLPDLVQRYGSAGQRFWDLLTVRRGEGPLINYPTERSIVETRPLICLSADEAMVFDSKSLLSAILLRGEEALANGPTRDQYFRRRDRILEDHSLAVLRRILGAESKVYKNVFETPDNQYEHDLVVVTADICLFVEAKASPMDEPFRDPERAIVRIRRGFRSTSGIQEAYAQSLRLYKRLQGQELVLFDVRGAEILRLPSSSSENAFCVCVTRDSFGPLATFLSPLLSKGVDDPYPWVVNILDLEQIAEAWEYFRWGGRQLRSLLAQRILLHEKVFSDDELDYVGAYIKHCGLHYFAYSEYDRVFLDPRYALVFDEIYGHLHHGQVRVTINPSYPWMTESQEAVKAEKTVTGEKVPEGRIVVGPNEQCPCGSTAKFKRCHGR